MNQRVAIFGGTGFVGRHLTHALLAQGYQVTIISRSLAPYQQRTQRTGLQYIALNLKDDKALHACLSHADIGINLIGILNERGRDGRGFHAAHVELTQRLVRAAEAAGVSRWLQMSALNAGQGKSHYLKSRGEAEAAVKRADLAWTIFQPSVIFGAGDGLFTRFAALLKPLPVMPLACANTRFAPVYVKDVAQAFVNALEQPSSAGQTYQLYGPQTLTLGDIVTYTAQQLHLRRYVLPLPNTLARLQASVMDFVPGKPFSSDNYWSLQLDSVGHIDGLAQLGISPTPITQIIPRQLGQSPRHRRLNIYRSRRLS